MGCDLCVDSFAGLLCGFVVEWYGFGLDNASLVMMIIVITVLYS